MAHTRPSLTPNFVFHFRRKIGEKIKRARGRPKQSGMRAGRISALVAAHPSFHARHFHYRGHEHRTAATRSHPVHAQLGGECIFFPPIPSYDPRFHLYDTYNIIIVLRTKLTCTCTESCNSSRLCFFSNNHPFTVNTISPMISHGMYRFSRRSYAFTINVFAPAFHYAYYYCIFTTVKVRGVELLQLVSHTHTHTHTYIHKQTPLLCSLHIT
jgi:hypothetical protein